MNELELMIVEAQAFHTRYNEKVGVDTLEQIENLRKMLKGNISDKLKLSIQSEIDDYENMDSQLAQERVDLFCKTMKYIWSHPEKESLLIISENEVENSYRSSNGAYDVNIYYTFTGPFGDLMTIVSDFGDTGEVYFLHDEKENVIFNNTLSYDDFKKVFIQNFVDAPDEFRNCFKVLDKVKVTKTP